VENFNQKCILYGYVDHSGSFIIKPKFERAINFNNGRAIVKQDNKYGVINKNGEYIIRPKYDDMKNPTENAIWVKTNGLWGLLDFSENFFKTANI
jgi:hypothetical protein